MKSYFLTFGSGDPRGFTGLAPTFLLFQSASAATLTPPAISAMIGGFYTFSYGTTSAIAFLADAATTSPGANGRYVVGSLDPNDRGNEYGDTLIAYGISLLAYGNSNIALGTTNVAIGTSLMAFGSSLIAIGNSNIALGTTAVAGITGLGASFAALSSSFALLGSPASSFGSTSVDPSTVFGFLMRAQEMAEGNQTFTKGTGLLDFFNRGSSTLLREKTITDTTTSTTKT